MNVGMNHAALLFASLFCLSELLPGQAAGTSIRLQSDLTSCAGHMFARIEASPRGRFIATSDDTGPCGVIFEAETGRSIESIESEGPLLFGLGEEEVIRFKALKPQVYDLRRRTVSRSLAAPELSPEEQELSSLGGISIQLADFDSRSGLLRAATDDSLFSWDFRSGRFLKREPFWALPDACDWSVPALRIGGHVCLTGSTLSFIVGGPNWQQRWTKRLFGRAEHNIALSRNQQYAALQVGGSIHVVRTATGTEVGTFKVADLLPEQQPPPTNETASFPGLDSLAVSDSGGAVYFSGSVCDGQTCGAVADPITRKLLWRGSFSLGGEVRMAPEGVFLNTPDSEVLFVSEEKSARLFTAKSGVPLTTLRLGVGARAQARMEYGQFLSGNTLSIHRRPTAGFWVADGLARWDPATGAPSNLQIPTDLKHCRLSPGTGSLVPLSCKSGEIVLWDVTTDSPAARIRTTASPGTVAVSEDFQMIAYETGVNVNVVDRQGAILYWCQTNATGGLFVTSSSKRLVAVNDGPSSIDRQIEIFSLDAPEPIVTIKQRRGRPPPIVQGDTLIVRPDQAVIAYSLLSGEILWQWKDPKMAGNGIYYIARLGSGDLLLQHEDGTVFEVDPRSGRLLNRYRWEDGPVGDAFGVGGDKFLFNGGALFDRTNGKLVANLEAWADQDWFVGSPDGRFDTSNLDGDVPFHWVTSDDPLRPLPVENYMRDFYTPGLFRDLVSGKVASGKLNVRDQNRALPKVRIAVVSSGAQQSSNVLLRIDVQNGQYRSASGVIQESGAWDLKIFRQGQLVDYIKGDLLKGAPGRTYQRSIRLPVSSGKRPFEFSAYAFNKDGVKCLTARTMIELPAALQVPVPRAFVLAIGVNETPKARLQLSYAINDARRFATVVGGALARSGFTASRVITRVLEANQQNPSGAAKSAIRAAFQALQSEVRPEDTVLVMFAGHGYTDNDGKFYLVPADVDGASPASMKRTSISSDELTEWFRVIDAKEMVFVLDACQSAASVTAEGFKPGPMTSAGLGQLAYDKRMRILAASQSDGVALEYGSLNHGVLTYSLLVEGLERKAADWQPKDGAISVGEWLRFAEREVPAIAERIRLGEVVGRGTRLSGGSRVPTVAGRIAQHPTLFDFRRRSETDLMIKEEGR